MMIKKIRTSKATKVLACYLAIMIFVEMTQPLIAYALTEGPSQPEFNSFTPIGTSDMVDLSSGDFNYNIPIMDVGGYPINLSYSSGVTMDQEASWVGLGWNLNVGQINRNVRGLPDDFRGDVVTTDNNLRKNVTIGVNPYINVQVIGVLDGPALSLGAGMDVQYNNYNGLSAIPSFGPTFKISDEVSVGMQISSSTDQGASITPSVSLSAKSAETGDKAQSFTATLSPSITYNSRQGLQSFNLSSSVSYANGYHFKAENGGGEGSTSIGSGSGSISFLNNTFTPSKRSAMKNNNYRFSFSGGPDVWGVHGEISIAGYGSVQNLALKHEEHKAYGYQFTEMATENDLLDFNREKELPVVTKNTVVLPVTNYTYDLYTVQGQGAGGMFRSFRGQVGHVYDPKVVDYSESSSVGIEIEGGVGAHHGFNVRRTTTTSYTGKWDTKATPFFKEKTSGNLPDYERTYFKNVGETRADSEYASLLNGKLGGSYPVTLMINKNWEAINVYGKKNTVTNQSTIVPGTPFTTQIKRNHREVRNQAIQKVTKTEVQRFGLTPFFKYNTDFDFSATPTLYGYGYPTLVPGHHTAGYIITDDNGNRSIYGETVYNKVKKEVSFNVGSKAVDVQNGLVTYSPDSDNSISNSKGRDHFFNSQKTPAYAHTYLLSSVLSNDYEDLTGNGPSDDDLGNYTKFTYADKGDYQWRVPFNLNKASYNEGLKTDKHDQKGSYLYGIKENKYLRTIITKTHVAIIDLDVTEEGVGVRRDGYGVNGENGGFNTTPEGKMHRIKKISLYSKADAAVMLDGNTANDNTVTPIKVAHFEYDYSLCGNIDNNNGEEEIKNGVDLNLNKGKLTLRKVYFTYGKSNMGKFTPYVFNYDMDNNPDYNVKAYDIWGNYMPFASDSWETNSTTTSPQEFPYVDQRKENRENQDKYASSWLLSSIELPSGGKIELQYEADDYKYVQDKRAMQMFKVDGVTTTPGSYNPADTNKNRLYTGGLTNTEATYIAIKLPASESDDPWYEENEEQIIRRYTDGLVNQSIYFNFMLNMTQGGSYDYVSGYFEMPKDGTFYPQIHDGYLFIPMKKINLEGNPDGGKNSNPITVAGLFFGRKNLNPQMNNLPDPVSDVAANIVNIGKSIFDELGHLSELWKGANGWLHDKGIAKTFKPNKSWIRLLEPRGSKVGGGVRVKRILMKDQWDKMMGISDESPDIDRYAKQYGQHYDYTLEDGTSSGVATYEPNICKENPLITPLYNSPEKLTEQTYQEKPFGESFFPSPTVTYSRVSVSNVTATDLTDDSHNTRSGKVVTEHYTTRDFPTIADYTNLKRNSENFNNELPVLHQLATSLLSIPITTKVMLSMGQGFVVETNDMNGKVKKQEIFNNAGALISGVEYKYSTNSLNPKRLENRLKTILPDGKVEQREIGSQYDVINDFRESYSKTNSAGVAANVDLIPIFIPIIVGWGKLEKATHEQILRTVVTTKVIHKTGVLLEKIAYENGSRVYTKNHAWDSKTGQVLLTETINEYDDKYYSMSYPAYWAYPNMGLASETMDITGVFKKSTAYPGYFEMAGLPAGVLLNSILHIGDELAMIQPDKRMWVASFTGGGTAVKLMRADGSKVTTLYPTNPFDFSHHFYRKSFRLMRPIHRNQQTASMASVTMMSNPIREITPLTLPPQYSITNCFTPDLEYKPKVINASGIWYKDYWPTQCENGLPPAIQPGINEYFLNQRGQWRTARSYAYLTGRVANASSNTRNSGYMKSFNPLYNWTGAAWLFSTSNWTFASEVTKYSPYGQEIENRDALNRYSSAQFGYKYKLPVAIGSNATYEEMGFDGFEDYVPLSTTQFFHRHFGFNGDSGTTGWITTKQSHTGNKSIRVKYQEDVRMKRRITDCPTEEEPEE